MPARALITALLLMPATVLAQDEVGKKDREKIQIDWAKHEGAKNYVIEYEKAIPLSTVKKVAEELDEILGQYVVVFRFKPSEKLKVQFLDNPNTYEQMGGIPSSAGFFSPGTETLVLKQLPFDKLIPTVYHEACHQYLHFYVGRGTSIPTWFNEGMAMYFECMQRQKGGAKKLDAKLIDNRKLRMMKDKVATRTALPLEKLIHAPYEEFHNKADPAQETLHYNESFSVIYFFMQGMGGKPIFQFTEELKSAKDPNAALEKLFGKDMKNLKSIEEKWKAYMTQVKVAQG